MSLVIRVDTVLHSTDLVFGKRSKDMIVLVCNKCQNDDLHRSKWLDEFECPHCGPIHLYDTQFKEIITEKELSHEKDKSTPRQTATAQ